MSKNWKLKRRTSTEIDYENRELNLGIHTIQKYPSLKWDIELYNPTTHFVVFDKGLFPQYDLTKKEVMRKIKKFMKKVY